VAAADHVLVRDTRDRTGPMLRFTPQECVLGATIGHYMYRR
jgi:Domain of unknown function (DUF397)